MTLTKAQIKMMQEDMYVELVQILMEKFNGGGHLTTAAAQVDISPEDAIEKILKYLEEE